MEELQDVHAGDDAVPQPVSLRYTWLDPEDQCAMDVYHTVTHTVPFLKRVTFRGHSRKVFGQRRPRSTLWVPSGPMDAPNDREAPGANPDALHCGPARRTWARAQSCMGTRHGAVHHEPARAPPWLPAARQISLGPLGTAPPLVDLALAVSEFAGARRVQTGAPRAQNRFFAFFIDP